MDKIALVFGILAVFFFLLSYLQKKRQFIVSLNLLSRMLYVAQYLCSALLRERLSTCSAFLAQKGEALAFLSIGFSFVRYDLIGHKEKKRA